jgi:hypothetical protein
MLRFQVMTSWTGTPRLSSVIRLDLPRAQSAESQMIRPADITTTCSLAGPAWKAQAPDPVETAKTSNFGYWPP